MNNDQFERFVDSEKAKLAECLRGCGRLDEDIPDMPGVSDADGLCEQFYNSIDLPVNAWVSRPNDGIDWDALEKELISYSHEILAEWMERKKSQDKADAFEMGRG